MFFIFFLTTKTGNSGKNSFVFGWFGYALLLLFFSFPTLKFTSNFASRFQTKNVTLTIREAVRKKNMKENHLSSKNAHTSVQVFENNMFGALRIFNTDEQKTLFNLTDVCRALEIKNTADTKKRLQKRGIVSIDTPTQNQYGAVVVQPMTYIDEANLYRCIFQSRKPEAEKFQTWVFEEVLPQIRRTGGYIPTKDATGQELTDMQIMCLAFEIQQKTIEARDRMIEELAPNAIYCDQVLESVDCLTTTQVAKGMGMTANELNMKLCQAGIQYGQSGQYMLYAPYARRGLAQNRTHTYQDYEGNTHTVTYLVWTEPGRHFIHNLFKNQNSKKNEDNYC